MLEDTSIDQLIEYHKNNLEYTKTTGNNIKIKGKEIPI